MSKKIQVIMSHVQIDGDARVQMIELLNQHLADAFDLYSQVKQAHWNVTGMNFIAVHELFDKIAHEVLEAVDDIAERVTALGGVAQGTARMAAANSRLPEFSDEAIQSEAAIKLSWSGSASSPPAPARPSTPPMKPVIWLLLTCSLKSSAKLTSTFTSSMPTCAKQRTV